MKISAGNSGTAITSVAYSGIGPKGAYFELFSASYGTAGNGSTIYTTNSSSYIEWSAEL